MAQTAILRHTFEATDSTQLSEEEATKILYILENITENNTYELNLGDPIQYEFVKNNLLQSGETNNNSPHTFSRLKQVHEELLKKGQTGPPQIDELGKAGPTDYTLYPANRINLLQSDGNLFKSVASSTYPGGTIKTMIIQNVMAVNNESITSIKSQKTTEYIGGHNIATSFQTELKFQTEPPIESEAFSLATFIVFPNDNIPKVYVNLKKGGVIQNTDDIEGKYDSDPATEFLNSSSTLDLPIHEVTTPGEPYKIALNRANSRWNTDYSIMNIPGGNNPGDLAIPLKGTFCFNKVITGSGGPPTGIFRVSVKSEGGGETVISDSPGSEISTSPLPEFTVGTGPNNANVYFDWSNGIDRSQIYDDTKQANIEKSKVSGLQNRKGKVYLTIELQVEKQEGGHTQANFTSDPELYEKVGKESFYKQIDSFTFYWGCLIKGTKIKMSDGSMKAIEDFEGDGNEKVIINSNGDTKIVLSTTRGFEENPCVTLKDNTGSSLMLTEDHPIVTSNRGVILAKYLEKGDILKTDRKEVDVIEVGRKQYDGEVWNLELGTEEEASRNETTLYADGYLVGDLSMQQFYGQQDILRKKANPLTTLPPEWIKDYEGFVAEATS